jgi:hypothetical protein
MPTPDEELQNELPPEPTPVENPAPIETEQPDGNKRVVQKDEVDNEGMEIPKWRVKMLMVDPTEFVYLFTKGLRLRKQTQVVLGVPDDAQVVSIAADTKRLGVMIVVQSEQYPEIPKTVLPPIQYVRFNLGDKTATKKKKQPRKKKK